MQDAYGATYPQDGDTAADAPADMVTMFADFFGACNLRLPLTIFMADLLEFYWIQISQLIPLRMMHVQLGFYPFLLRDNAPKIMPEPPKGFTAWKSKFYYVKEVAVTCKLYFRNVTENIPKENITIPVVGK
ncbi:hypothetical protein Hanom_Chr10g00910051 [Helianthus anomalus]